MMSTNKALRGQRCSLKRYSKSQKQVEQGGTNTLCEVVTGSGAEVKHQPWRLSDLDFSHLFLFVDGLDK